MRGSFFVDSGIYSFIANLLIGAYVFLKAPKKPINIFFGLFSLCVSGWSVGSYVVNIIPNKEIALWILRFNYLFGVWLPAFYVNFIYLLIGTANNSFQNTKLRFCYLISALLTPFVFMPVFISGLKTIGETGFFISSPGPVYYVFFLYFGLGMSEVLINTVRGLSNPLEIKRSQAKSILFANVLAICAGFEYFSRVFGLIKAPPYDDYILVLYLLVVAYAIIRHQLLDIQVIIRRTVVFAGLLAFVFGIYSTATIFIRRVLNDFFFVSDFWANAISIFLIVLGYDPLRTFLINLTDKHLFQKQYDYHKVLKDASRGMAKIESLRHLLGLVLHFVTMKMRVENAAVLSFESNDRLFRLVASRGYKKHSTRISLNIDHPLISVLRDTHEAVHLNDILERLENNEVEESQNDLKIISEEMKTLGAKCAIPSFLGTDLKNVLLIGDKKSGEPHTSEDISLLMTLAQESSIAIENARLYDEAIKKQRQLGQINEQLEHSKKMLVNALSEAEGANKQLQDTQAQLIHEQKMATLGRLAASVGHEVNNPLTILSMNVSRAILKFRKNPDLKVSEILDVFDKMEKNIERIKAVVNTLTGLLKKSEKGKFEPLSLKLILEETLPLVQFQTYMDNLTGTEVELNVPGNIPLIRGDLERLQEIFLNLFINAYHAMANKRFRKIRVDAELDPSEVGMVSVNFNDNGSGMSEETMKKIFNYGYTTKPPGKGSGLGLYMCKYIVELHGGTIRVKSKLGEGTTFTVTLPIYKEEPTAASVSQKQPSGDNPKSSVA